MESKDAPSTEGLVASLLEALPNPVFVKDETHRWVLLNASFCELVGRERSELLGKLDVDFFPPDETRVFWATDDAVFAGAGVNESEERFTDSSGQTHIVITRKSLHTDASGGRLLLGVITDITAQVEGRKRAEESLREQLAVKEQLAKIAESVPGAIYAFRLRPDGSTSMPFAAPAVEDLFGISRDVLANDMAPYFANVHADDIQRVTDDIAEAARMMSGWHAEFRYEHPTKGLRWIEGWSSPIAESDGATLWHGYVTDVTEGKRTELALRESEKHLGLFIDHAPVALAMFDRQMRYLHVSHAWLTDYELGDQDLRGLSHYEVFPEIGEEWKQVHRRALEGEVVRADADRFVRADGSVQWLRWEVRPWREVGGGVGGIVIFSEDITEAILAGEEAREREQWLRLAHDTAGAGTWQWDLRTNENVWSDELWKLYGLRKGSCAPSYEDWREVIVPEDREKASQMVGDAARRGSEISVEFRVLYGDGTVHHLLSRARPLLDKTGRPEKYLGIVIDITERKLIEETLRESQATLDLALRSARMGTWQWDIATDRRRFDDQVCRLLGLNSATFSGAAAEFFAAVHPEDREKLSEAATRAIEQGVPYDPEYRVVWPDGSIHYVCARGGVTRDRASRPLRLDGILWDISERKQAEDALRESEERLRVVVQAAGEGILMRRADGVIAVFNPAAERLMGLTAGQIQGLTPTPPGWYTVREDGTLLPTEERPNRVALRTGNPTSNVILGHHQPDGTTTWCSVNSQPVFGPGQAEPYAVVATLTDITAQRQQAVIQRHLEEQLQQARKLESIGRLAGGIAHDFNNLLTVILSCADTLKEDVAAGAPVLPEVIDEILAGGKRAADLTRQLLAFARKQVIAPEALDLNTLVLGSEQLLRRLLGEDVELVTMTQSDLWTVRCDRGQIEQVILNLAINARDAMPGGGTLTIGTTNQEIDERFVVVHPFMRVGAYVKLEVSDSGVGMTPDVRAHAFEPFFTTKTQGKGTGLGLATVYGIVKQSEGYILLESTEGRGTTFELYFPRALGTAVEASSVAPAPASGGRETVLVVEDDPQVREVTLRALRAGGYRVLAASSGREALEVAAREEGPLHLLVTDVVMPGLNGRQLANELTRLRPTLRVLFVSGYAGDVIAQAGAVDSGVELLGKPFTKVALLGRVRALLDAQ